MSDTQNIEQFIDVIKNTNARIKDIINNEQFKKERSPYSLNVAASYIDIGINLFFKEIKRVKGEWQ